MPIKWSAVRVCQAMDDVENQLSLAEAFLAEAKIKASEARKIPDIPGYITQRLVSLIAEIERIDKTREAIAQVRKSIPQGAIELEKARIRNGSQNPLI